MISDPTGWTIIEDEFEPARQSYRETVFTIGNGYLSTRGAFEEGYPGERRATFVHGVFDRVPIVVTELANAPDWLAFAVFLDGERFALDQGTVESFCRTADLRTGLLRREVGWLAPNGRRATLVFERFTSMDDEHLLALRCQVTPEFDGQVEVRAAFNAAMDNEGYAHWHAITQGLRGELAYLSARTRTTQIELALAMRLESAQPALASAYWDAAGAPTFTRTFAARKGQTLEVTKFVGIATSRDGNAPVEMAVEAASRPAGWQEAFAPHAAAWEAEWQRSDVIIEGDVEAQQAMRFSLFQLLIAAPRHDDRVNIGAKTLSGFGYRGHSFWDTEIFMLPLFIFTAPHIAKNLLNYRYMRLEGARQKARANGFEGAQFPWESADTGEEVTPTWLPHFADRTKLVRIWTGDIEIHISADIAFAAHRYWSISGDDAWFIEKGCELILDTAKFWASRGEWNAEKNRYDYNDVIGPDENHDRINNNFYTNRLAQWNLQTAFDILDWLKFNAPERGAELSAKLDLSPARLDKWHHVIAHIYLPDSQDGVIEQFEGYYQCKPVDLPSLEPRHISVQELLGIEGACATQVLKQPDVVMLQYLLRDQFTVEQVRANYDYYTPKTDHTHGSSLGPSIQAIMACEVGKPDDAYEHFIRAARADLFDVRNNAGDGIHAASAGGIWQAAVFGFGGLTFSAAGWQVRARLPKHWQRLSFKFYYRGEQHVVDLSNS
jgi:trehalose/maltose hydrolase-like predicted phosphorylase